MLPIVREPHAIVADLAGRLSDRIGSLFAFDLVEVAGVGSVLDVGPHAQHLHEAPEAGIALLELLGEVDELLDRRDEDADVEGVYGQIGNLEGALRHEVAAAHDGNRIEYADEHRVHRVERSHEPVRQLLGVDESMVALVELADLDALVSERFHHADATERILEPCVDIGHLLAVLGEYRPLAVVPPERVGRHEHGGDEHDERERHVDEEQKRERARDLEDADEEVLGAVVGELGYVEQVGNELAHHGAGVVAVVVGEAQALVLLEQILAHVGLHARAHDVAPARDEVLARRTDGVHGRE